jgi:hypothetical protein
MKVRSSQTPGLIYVARGQESFRSEREMAFPHCFVRPTIALQREEEILRAVPREGEKRNALVRRVIFLWKAIA